MATATTLPQREQALLEPVTPELLDEVVRRIVAAVDPEKVILFGSHANGTPHEYSDIDLFIVRSGVTRPREVASTIYGLFWDKAVELHVLVSSPDRIERELMHGNSFIRNEILGQGTVLYARRNGDT